MSCEYPGRTNGLTVKSFIRGRGFLHTCKKHFIDWFRFWRENKKKYGSDGEVVDAWILENTVEE